MSSRKARETLVLTGASRGIGHVTVKRFSDEQWRIITCSCEEVPTRSFSYAAVILAM
ncbi:NAD(P)-dependent dehydrogenase (short-subunit alcohol dehydrogenase family) [Limibacillus sp. MBR-115]|jgi:NAD(P)-dependent dehydrogenase (short-subunit alcohol dehydrogenase family)